MTKKKDDSAMTEAAKAMGSRGGKARAKNLSPAARKQIASDVLRIARF